MSTNRKPYCHSVRKEGISNVMQSGLVLESISSSKVGDTQDRRVQRLSSQLDFVASLKGLGTSAGFELRINSSPQLAEPHRGSIQIGCRLSLVSNSADEMEDLHRGMAAGLMAMSADYSWKTLENETEFLSVFSNDEAVEVWELARRETFVDLSRSSEAQRYQNVGFVQGEPEDIEDSAAYVCLPFIRGLSNLQDLFVELLQQPHPLEISICLWPTRASSAEKSFLLDQLLLCERFAQLPNSGLVTDPRKFFPSLRGSAELVRKYTEEHALGLTDAVFEARVFISSRCPVPPMIRESIGIALTDPIHSPYAERQTSVLGGGYDWIHHIGEDRLKLLSERKHLMPTLVNNSVLPAGNRLRRLLNVNQAGCVFRLPLPIDSKFPGLQTRLYSELPPATTGKEGIQLGTNSYRSFQQPIFIHPSDRLRHMYVVGQTGTGKSTLLENMVVQDLAAGEGLCVLDPHGELIQDIVERVPASRENDVVLLRPTDSDSTLSINLLDAETDLERDSVVNFFLEVFDSLYNMKVAGGPVFESYFRNALLLLISGSHKEATLLDFERIFVDSEFRKSLIAACDDSQVVEFWNGVARKAGGDMSLENVAPYVSSKLGRLTSSLVMKKIIGNPETSLDFSQLMESRKIVLVDLCKGQLGSTNSHFLAMLIAKCIQQAAFRRDLRNGVHPFYLYVDEFQNLATESFVQMLSEGRKFGLGLTIANQYFRQIPEDVRDAVIGNVGTTVAFRIGARDAEELTRVFVPMVDQMDLMNLPNFHAYVRGLREGNVTDPVNIKTESYLAPITIRYAEIESDIVTAPKISSFGLII